MRDPLQWWLACHSEAGTSHVADGRLCEDACFLAATDEGSFVLVACDGAGSKKFSRAGAAAVAAGAGRLLLANASCVMSRKLHPDVVVDVALSELERLVEAQGGGAVVSDFATTLVALLVHEGQAMTCHVGDGAIFMLEGEHPRCISPPDRDPGGGSGTRFVTCRGARPRMWLYPVPAYVTGFLAVTDGAQPALYNSVTNACSPLVSRALNRFDLGDSRAEREELLGGFLCSELQPRSDDDITLVGARRACVAGLYGCPECKQPAVEPRMHREGKRFYGVCRACHHMAFAHDEDVDGMRQRYERMRLSATISAA